MTAQEIASGAPAARAAHGMPGGAQFASAHVGRRRAGSPRTRPHHHTRPTASFGRAAMTLRPPLDGVEQHRRLSRATAYLVRTLDGCPAPGIPPLTRTDRLFVAVVVGLPLVPLLWTWGRALVGS